MNTEQNSNQAKRKKLSAMDNSKKSGPLLVSGLLSPWILNKEKNGYIPVEDRNMLTKFHRFTTEKYQFVASSGYSNHSILIDSKGRTLSMGENKQYECGQPNASQIYDIPTVIPKLNKFNIIQAACGRHHSLFLSDEGQVYACGDNSKGQCGIDSDKKSLESPKLIKYDGPKIVKISCGADFSVILDVDGNMYAFGLPEFGQLGNNTDGQYFITANKLSFHFVKKPLMITHFTQEEQRGKLVQMQGIKIKDIACGKFHTLALDTMGRVFTWGFSGNGELGHNGNKNEYQPRLIKYLTATKNVISKIYAGVKHSVVLTVNETLFVFGEHNGKNVMYPQQINEAMGYTFDMAVCSTSVLAVTTSHELIVWGKLANGELGIGNDPRSSATPRENVDMKGLKIIHMALGKTHSMVLVDTECKDTNKKYLKFPDFKIN